MQGNDVGTQYRYGIYFYTPKQENAARVFGTTTEALEQEDCNWDTTCQETLPSRGIPSAIPRG